MTRYIVEALIVLLVVSGGCAARSAGPTQTVSSGYQLMDPPDVRDPRYPGGVHVRSDAALETWHQVAAFATYEECESSRIHRIDATIDEARMKVGDQAKYQLPVRRAVRARCVSAR